MLTSIGVKLLSLSELQFLSLENGVCGPTFLSVF